MKKMMGLVAANYSNDSFGALTTDRPIASIPFGGRYRLVDFPLSNMVNSGILTVGLVTPYMYRSLMDHVGVGKEWALNRKIGGMFILPGSVYGIKNIQGKFLLRDLIRNKAFFERGGRDLVVISGCSKIFNIDFRKVAKFHEESGKDVTLIYKNDLTPDEGTETYLEMDKNGSVSSIKEKSNGKSCFLDAIVINLEMLMNIFDWYAALSYMDLMEIFEENLDKIKVGSYEFTGYVGAVNGVHSYMKANLQLLDEDVRKALFLPERQISTKVQDSTPAKYLSNSKVTHSFVSTGCIIEGTVENCILFRGVHVKSGASLRNCVVMQKCVIGENASLENIVCDKYVTVKDNVNLAGSTEKPITIGKKQEI